MLKLWRETAEHSIFADCLQWLARYTNYKKITVFFGELYQAIVAKRETCYFREKPISLY
jgi:hypothetical protein